MTTTELAYRMLRDRVRDSEDSRTQFAKLALTAAIQFERGQVFKAWRNVTRLWNHADNQKDCEFLWDLLTIACPWAFGSADNPNSHLFVYDRCPCVDRLCQLTAVGWRLVPLWAGQRGIRMQRDGEKLLLRVNGDVTTF